MKKNIALISAVISMIIVRFFWGAYGSELFGVQMGYKTVIEGIIIGEALMFGLPALVYALLSGKGSDNEVKVTGTNILRTLLLVPLVVISMYAFRELIANISWIITGREIFDSEAASVSRSMSQWIMAVAGIVVAVPCFEELWFRKIYVCSFQEIPGWITIAISSLSFLSVHSSFKQMVYLCPMALLCGVLAKKTNTIAYSIVIHSICNLTGLILPGTYNGVFSLKIASASSNIVVSAVSALALLVLIVISWLLIDIIERKMAGGQKEGTEESGTGGKKLITVIYLIISIAAIIFVGLGERLLPASEHIH